MFFELITYEIVILMVGFISQNLKLLRNEKPAINLSTYNY